MVAHGPTSRCKANLLRYLVDEAQHKKKQVLDVSEWTILPSDPATPQQQNGSDCGVFTSTCADFISQGKVSAGRSDPQWTVDA